MVSKHIIDKIISTLIHKHYSEPSHPSNVVFLERADKETIDDIFSQLDDLEDIRDIYTAPINDRGIKTKEGLDVYSLTEIGKSISEKYPNLSVKEVNDKRLTFTDTVYDVEIQLGSFIKRQDLIDFTDNGQGEMNLSEFIDIYDSMPSTLKSSTSKILLDNHDNNSCRNEFYDANSDNYNVVYLTPQMFGNDTDGGVPRAMAHELFHSLDVQYRLSDREKEVYRKNFVTEGKLTVEEEDIMRGITDKVNGSRISSSGAWDYQLLKDYKVQDNLGLPRQHPSAYGNHYARNHNGSGLEDFADVGSMVALSEGKYSGSARLYGHDVNAPRNPLLSYPVGEVVELSDFEKRNPNQFKVAKGILDGKIKVSSNGYNFEEV